MVNLTDAINTYCISFLNKKMILLLKKESVFLCVEINLILIN